MRSITVAKVLLPLLMMAGAVSAFAYLKATRPQQPRPQPQERTWLVDIVAAAPARRAPILTLYGRVEAPTLLQHAAPGTGVVNAVYVRNGQRVSRGDPLLTMDPRDFEPAVAQARAELADLQAQIEEMRLRRSADEQALVEEQQLLTLARNTVERARELQRKNLGSESTLEEAQQALGRQQLAVTTRQLAVDSYRSRMEQLRARLQHARAQLAQAELALERSRLLAPFDGVVSTVRVAAGDRVQNAQELLATYPLDDLEVRARVPARYQSEIQQALADGRTLAANLRESPELELILVRLAGEADPSGIDAFFRIGQTQHLLRPGNLVELELERPPQDDLIAIPFQAVYGNNRIYLLRDGRMHGVDVDAVGGYRGDRREERLLIRSPDITAGDSIIVTHLPNAVTGLRVEVGASRQTGEGAS